MTITKTASLPVSPDEAFALITEPERLRRWMAVSAYVDLRAGGVYRWTVTPGHHTAGTFQEVEPGRRLVFGWGADDSADLPPDSSTVIVTIEPAGAGCVVTLVHDGLTPEDELRHGVGWDHFLERLEKLATDGDAGQDEWAWAPEDLDPVVASEAVLAALQPMLRNVTSDDQDKPTPCADFTCHDLAEHLLRSLGQVGAMAGQDIEIPSSGSLEERVSVTAAEAIESWRIRGLEGTVPGPGGSELPAAFAASILPLELLLHGWDLAQGSRQTLRVSDEVVAYVAGLAESVITGGRGRSFGDEVAPAPDASPLDRLAAYAGRSPIAA